jgi:hypothetical protein
MSDTTKQHDDQTPCINFEVCGQMATVHLGVRGDWCDGCNTANSDRIG